MEQRSGVHTPSLPLSRREVARFIPQEVPSPQWIAPKGWEVEIPPEIEKLQGIFLQLPELAPHDPLYGRVRRIFLYIAENGACYCIVEELCHTTQILRISVFPL